MNKTVIQNMIEGSFAGTIVFPEVVASLLKEGIESYHVDYIRNENTYYHTNGDSIVIDVKHQESKVADQFSIDGIRSIIKKVQTGEVDYNEFCIGAKAAGCAYYIAFLKGKRVLYLGKEGDQHVEYFPRK